MRVSDWSSDVCSSDLITVGQAFDAVGFDPTPYLSTKKNFYRNYGYNDTGEADLDTPFDAATAKGIAATVEVELGSATIKRSEEHTSELQSLMRNSYAVFCLKKKTLRQKLQNTCKQIKRTDF